MEAAIDYLGGGKLRKAKVKPDVVAYAEEVGSPIPLLEVQRVFDFVATAAPGVKEIVTVGKPVYEVHERRYDLVVVDAVATGHIVGLLAAPQAINDLVRVGLVRSQTGWMTGIQGRLARKIGCILS